VTRKKNRICGRCQLRAAVAGAVLCTVCLSPETPRFVPLQRPSDKSVISRYYAGERELRDVPPHTPEGVYREHIPGPYMMGTATALHVDAGSAEPGLYRDPLLASYGYDWVITADPAGPVSIQPVDSNPTPARQMMAIPWPGLEQPRDLSQLVDGTGES
jgi:hypothetical protein